MPRGRCTHAPRGVVSAFVGAAMLVGLPGWGLHQSWPPADDLVALGAARAGDSSAGSVPNQVHAGRDVYLRECARCHGPIDGEGLTAPSLFGAESAQKLASFQTSQALYTFIRFAMPQDKPGSLPEEDYWAVLAFVLMRNGFIGEDFSVGPETVVGLRLQR